MGGQGAGRGGAGRRLPSRQTAPGPRPGRAACPAESCCGSQATQRLPAWACSLRPCRSGAGGPGDQRPGSRARPQRAQCAYAGRRSGSQAARARRAARAGQAQRATRVVQQGRGAHLDPHRSLASVVLCRVPQHELLKVLLIALHLAHAHLQAGPSGLRLLNPEPPRQGAVSRERGAVRGLADGGSAPRLPVWLLSRSTLLPARHG